MDKSPLSNSVPAYGSTALTQPLTGRTNRIYPVTRWVSAFIIPFLVVAFIMLYFWPNNTQQLFAWTIRPQMTPLLMAAGYIAGAYFFVRVILAEKWHHVALGFLPVTTFASFMTIATFLHWDRFNHSHISFFAWVALYATTPFIVAGLWLYNRRVDPGVPDAQDVLVPRWMRQVIGIAGAINLVTGVLLMIFPAVMISIWPWSLTMLTARVIGGWFALPGVVGIGVALDPRWSASRIVLQSQIAGIILILIGVARAWNDFNQANPMTWLVVGGIGLLLVALVALYISMETRMRASASTGLEHQPSRESNSSGNLQ